MRILAIETSCDETGAAIVEGSAKQTSVNLLSNSLASSLTLHAKTGGVIPEIAAREQLKYILPVIDEALKKADLSFTKTKAPDIDAIAVTYGPGLIGSLLIGVETAKTLSYVWDKPLIPVNHLYGHIYANWIKNSSSLRAERSNLNLNKEIAASPSAPRNDKIEFPALALVVSGGHTDLVVMKGHGNLTWIGGTRDDAAGEAFDKIGRLIGLSAYPAGPAIEKAALKGRSGIFKFPRPMLHQNTNFSAKGGPASGWDFSFSGLKTAVLREVQHLRHPEQREGSDRKDSSPSVQNDIVLDEQTIADIALETENAIVDVLVAKTIKAAEKYTVKSILLGGGVAANTKLQETLALEIRNLKLEISLHIPPKFLCTDNAAMIGAAAIYNNKEVLWRNLAANPQLYFD